MKITSAEHIVSAFTVSQFPKHVLPEIAFAGRSNVGKSSLLNCLAGRKIAKTSGTPGKTRSINFFLMNQKFCFVDLPGYGYARVSKRMRAEWPKLIESYIGKRPNLRAVVVIIDARREQIPMSDVHMIDYLLSEHVPCIPVFTKIDKLNRSGLARIKRLHENSFPGGYRPVFFSAVTKAGFKELSGCIAGYIE